MKTLMILIRVDLMLRKILHKISQLHNKAYYDSTKQTAAKYIGTVGDYVMIRIVNTTPSTCKKLLPKLKGPYKISKILPHD